MPKRSADARIEHYQRKIQKLRDKESDKRRRVRVIFSDSSDENSGDEVTQITTNAEVHGPSSSGDSAVVNPSTDAAPEAESGPQNDVSEPAETSDTLVVDPTEEPKSLEVTTSEPELDPELLEALGESTDTLPEYGPKIHENLAKLWLPLLKKGMTKENKDKLLKQYLIPENCTLLQAPKLNAEISAAVPDVVRNRDKGLLTHQQQLGSGITAINRALDLLLKGDNKKEAIQHLSNSCRILSDLHTTSTQTRIKLITPSLDKSFLHVIQDAERDETLFGNKLSDKIKAAKAIEKQGLQIKKPTNLKAPNSQTSSNRFQNAGNWSAPPRYSSNRGRGGPRRSNQNRRPYQSPAPRTPAPQAAATSKPRAPTTQ